MANTVKTRIQLKYDTEVNWNKAINFIPLKGELIIYSADDAHPFSRIKVGDGLTSIVNLPFINSEGTNGSQIYADTTIKNFIAANFNDNGGLILRTLENNNS